MICWRVSSLSLAKLGSWRSTLSDLLTGSISSTQSIWPISRNVVMMLLTVRFAATWADWLSITSAGPSGQFLSIHFTSGGALSR